MSGDGIHFDNLDDFVSKLERAVNEFPQDFESKLGKINQKLTGNIQRNTPVDSGDLRRDVHPIPVTKEGDSYQFGAAATSHYAPHVEYGHRNRTGDGFVPGAHMFDVGTRQTVNTLQADLEQFVQEKLGDLS